MNKIDELLELLLLLLADAGDRAGSEQGPGFNPENWRERENRIMH